jgi:Fe-S-cluster containining protein
MVRKGVNQLHQIDDVVRDRAREIVSAHPDWPCRKGCDDCCRGLTSTPRVSRAEWERIAAVLDEAARRRIRESVPATRPAVCPLLDRESGACAVYEARPAACRAYGFYVERGLVLGCGRIEAIARERPDVLWGNHAALEDRLRLLGETATLAEWMCRNTGKLID